MRISKPLCMIGVSVFLLLGSSLQAQQCSPKTTVGKYLVVCNGYLSPGPNAPLLPAKGLETAVADEMGTFTGSGAFTLGGTIIADAVKGTEKLNPDCTGTITFSHMFNGHPGPDSTDYFVVSKNGDQIDGIGIDPGSVMSCVLTREPEGKD